MTALYQSVYSITDQIRHAEITHARQLNLTNDYISKLVLLVEGGVQIAPHPKIILVPVAEQPTIGQMFAIAAQFGDDISIIANIDISFDDTIKLANHLGPREILAISRYDFRDGSRKLVVGNDSQDAWCFSGIVTAEFGDYRMGQRGCDNRLAYDLTRAGYRLTNPCHSIIAIHHHASHERSYYDYIVPGPYMPVQQCRFPI